MISSVICCSEAEFFSPLRRNILDYPIFDFWLRYLIYENIRTFRLQVAGGALRSVYGVLETLREER